MATFIPTLLPKHISRFSRTFPSMSGRYRGRGGGGGGYRSRGGGKGAYYANKYARTGTNQQQSDADSNPATGRNYSDPSNFRQLGDRKALTNCLSGIHGSSYPAYKALIGKWNLGQSYNLFFDRIQGDPFAAPSRARIRVDISASGFPASLYESRTSAVAFCDYLTRKFWSVAHEDQLDRTQAGSGWSGPKGGSINIDKPGQHVLQRSSCLIVDKRFIELRFTVSLPARGRTIQGDVANFILTEKLPLVVEKVLFAQTDDAQILEDHVTSVCDQEHLRNVQLPQHGLIAFVINGAILPRVSGAGDKPMSSSNAIQFESPDSLAVEIELLSGKRVKGMGIKPGISLIVGGGFHGKSTLLSALELGIYNHIPGDGREYVVVDPSTASIRAEDGRSVTGVDITPFINNLPFGKNTSAFSTQDASGSTSQAANIMEAIEAGAKVLLTDEDLAATNFMVRDQRMQELVPPSKEPITPMIQRIRALFEEQGISSILVIGGTGDYFEVSDRVIMMDSYKPYDVTKKAKKISKRMPGSIANDADTKGLFETKKRRRLATGSIQRVVPKFGKVSVKVKGTIQFGGLEVDLSAIAQLVEVSQTRAIAAAIETIGEMNVLEEEGVTACIAKLANDIEENGLDAVNRRGERIGTYAWPRSIEIQGALNRLRGIALK